MRSRTASNRSKGNPASRRIARTKAKNRPAAVKGGRVAALAPATEEGIDVSRYQGTVTWTKVAAAGITFAYIKATEGSDHVDPNFADNWVTSQAAGVRRGAYHFFAPGDPVDEQAANFSATVAPGTSDLPPALDLERNGQDWSALPLGVRVSSCVKLLKAMEQHTGMRPVVYTNSDTVATIFGDDPGELAQYPLWVASYRSTPKLPTGWSGWMAWQYTEKGVVSGVNGDVDRDRRSA
jgi:lysozyme